MVNTDFDLTTKNTKKDSNMKIDESDENSKTINFQDNSVIESDFQPIISENIQFTDILKTSPDDIVQKSYLHSLNKIRIKPLELLKMEELCGHILNDNITMLLIKFNIVDLDSILTIVKYTNIVFKSKPAIGDPANKSSQQRSAKAINKNPLQILDLIGSKISSLDDHSNLVLNYPETFTDKTGNHEKLRSYKVNIDHKIERVLQYFFDNYLIFLKQKYKNVNGSEFEYRFYVLNGQSYKLGNFSESIIVGPNGTSDENIIETLAKFNITDTSIINHAIPILNQGELFFKKYLPLPSDDQFRSVTIKTRMLEIIEHVGNFVNNSTEEELTSASQSIVGNSYSRNNPNAIMLQYLIDNNVIIKKSKKKNHDQVHETKYLIINGQKDPFSHLLTYSPKEAFNIYNVIKKFPNGISLNKIGSIYRPITSTKAIDYLIKNKIIFRDDTTGYLYIPTIKERILLEISIGLNNPVLINNRIHEIIETISLLETQFSNNSDSSIKNQNNSRNYISNTDIITYLNELVEDNYLEYDENSGAYTILKSNINKYLGLVPDSNNATNVLDCDKVREILSLYKNFSIFVDLLTYLLSEALHNNPPPLSSQILQALNKKDLRFRIKDAKINPLIYLFEMGIIHRYTEAVLKLVHYEINPILIDAVNDWLNELSNSTGFDIYFGWHEYHLVVNYITYILSISKSITKEKLIESLETIPEIKIIQHGIEVAINDNITIEKMIRLYFANIDFSSNNFNILFNIYNTLIKSGTYKDAFYGIQSGTISINYKQFYIKNKGDATKALHDFITILTWKHPSDKSNLLSLIKKGIHNNIDSSSSELRLVKYIENFWQYFAGYFYGDNPVDMLITISYFLHYCDNSLDINLYTIISQDAENYYLKFEIDFSKSSPESIFYDYLIKDVEMSDLDITVPDVTINNKQYSRKTLIDLIILSLLAGITPKDDILGHPLTPNDKTGNDHDFNNFRIGGHSDTARRIPAKWVQFTNFIDRIYGNDWWIPQQLRNATGLLNIEFKNASTNHIVNSAQLSYLLGVPDAYGIPSGEIIKQQSELKLHRIYHAQNNLQLTFNLLNNKYKDKIITIQSDDFIEFLFSILSIIGGINKSIVSISRPQEYGINILNNEIITKKGMNTVIVTLNNLPAYNAFTSLVKAFLYIFNNSYNADIKDFFSAIGIHTEYNGNNSNSFIIKKFTESFLIDLNKQLTTPKHKLIKLYGNL